MIFISDDDLSKFELEGALPLPKPVSEGFVEHENAKIWYATYGSGYPVVLLHGGLGNSGNWGYQVTFLIDKGYMPIVIDSRGHGKSTRDGQAYSYRLMVQDLKAVLEVLKIDQVGLVGWSDGAVTALIFADIYPERVAGIVYFACNMDNSGTIENIVYTPVVQACFNRHKIDFERFSKQAEGFNNLVEALTIMQKSQPNYTEDDLKRINVPVLVVHSEYDEFIKEEHSRYLAKVIPGASFQLLQGVSHFAPLQRPDLFNEIVLGFFEGIKY